MKYTRYINLLGLCTLGWALHCGSGSETNSDPSITSLVPSAIPSTSPEPVQVTVRGKGLMDGASVLFGDKPVATLAVSRFGEATFVAPSLPNFAGPVTVSIVNSAGTSTNHAGLNYYYATVAYAPPVTANAGVALTAIGIGHFNQDGNVDAVATSSADNRVRFFNGDGMGGLSLDMINQPAVGSPGKGHDSLAVADFDADGTPDVAVSDNTTNFVVVSKGGTKQYAPMAPMAGMPTRLRAVDVNADKKPDLVALFPNALVTWINQSTPTAVLFSNPVSLSLRGTPVFASFVDLDDQQGPDWLVGFDDGLDVYRQQAGGGFVRSSTDMTKPDVPLLGATKVSDGVLLGNWFEPGVQGIVVGSTSTQNQAWVLGSFAGSLSPSGTTFPLSGQPTAVSLADVDRGFGPDLVVATKNQIDVYLKSFAPSEFMQATAKKNVGMTSAAPSAIETADLNKDDKPDVLVLAGTRIETFLNQSQ